MPKLSDEAMQDIVDNVKKFFTESNPKNYTRKSYRDLTSFDFRELGNKELDLFRTVMSTEQYSYIDQILPKEMSRAEFSRAVLREMARRNAASEKYISPFRKEIPNFQSPITLVRAPYGGPEQNQSRAVTELAAVIALRDAGVEMVSENAPSLRLKDDLATKIGTQLKGQLPIDTDVMAYDFGYTVGSMKQFNGGPLHMQLDTPLQPNALQAAYCPTVNTIFQEGRAYDNRDAWAMGFMQARIDSRSQFNSTNDSIGLFGNCPKPEKGAAR